MTDLTSEIAQLAQAHCVPRKGAAHRLDAARANALLTQLPGWELVENGEAIVKTFKFDDYYHTMSFVNALAHVANREDHHPDLGVHYNRCVVRYSTHDVGGLSENDFICAAKTEALA
jgi:4a-hydroxytetrahydrobiopterin dehydratase